MSRTAKISISLPADILEVAERERGATGESRSQFFRRAVETLLRQEQQRLAAQQYMAGYVAEPETPYDTETIDQASRSTLGEEP
ncbi:MAG: ribbon-helix-helix protein, CopG family, partial [Acidobacteriota bacterium]